MTDDDTTQAAELAALAELADLDDAACDDLMLADVARLRRARRRLGDGKAAPGESAAAARQRVAALQARIEASRANVAQRRAQVLPTAIDPALPIAAHADDILAALAASQVVIVCGSTGSGKTTQLPKLCLRAGLGVRGAIGHTQPRRLAARSVATRIAEELDTPLGGLVGYRVRFGDVSGPDCRVKLMTDGILLQELRRDRRLTQYDCLIIDEAHERSLNIDFLLGYLRRLMRSRPDLKIVITSATIDPQRFARFFDDAPVIEVGGRGYPVEVRYRPADELALEQQVAAAVMDLLREQGSGDVLVFLPGEKDIARAMRALGKAGAGRQAEVLPLFARLNQKHQQQIFSPGARRRVILATNIAETSLTVPRIRYVVDSGLARIGRYSYRSKLQRLPIEKISRASAEQRAGRCGRLGPGVCVRLYDAEDFDARDAFTEPEIRRTNLASVILQMLILRLGEIESFPFLEPPDPRYVKDGYGLLQELNAVDGDGRVTALGRRMAAFPVDPRLARVLVAASELGCLDEALIIVSGLAVPDPRERPPDKSDKADQQQAAFADSRSDFMSLLNLWNAYHALAGGEGARWKWCREHFVSRQRLIEWQDVHRQLASNAREQRLVGGGRPAGFAQIHRALLCGFVSQFGQRTERNLYASARGRQFTLFPGSALSAKPPPWVVVAELVETSRVFGRVAAAIKTGWLREAGAHLLRLEYLEPAWSEARGQVTAIEHAQLFGLSLGGGRRVNYGRIDAAAAREIFIDHALLDAAPDPRRPFTAHNRALRADARALQARLRRALINETRLHDAFAARLPAEVCDRRSLNRWYERSPAEHDARLRLSPGDYGIDRRPPPDAFPDTLAVGDNPLALRYRFAPGEDDDGVTVRVPEPLLPMLDAAAASWLVPGYLEDKVLALLRALPKSLRRQLVPVTDTARRFCDRAGERGARGNDESLHDALARFLRDDAGAVIDASDWSGARLEPWLTLRVEVVDEQGKVIAASRDIARLERRSRKRGATTVRSTQWQRDGLTRWTFDDLPETVDVTLDGMQIVGSPALVDRGDAVALRVMPSLADAQRQHRRGVVRLALLNLQDKRRYLRKQLPDASRLSLLYLQLGSFDALLDDILWATVDAHLDALGAVPRTRAAFDAWLVDLRRDVVASAQDLAALALVILGARQQVATRLSGTGSGVADAVREDLASQLAHLVPAGFVATTPPDWLAEIPRFLDGMQRRLDRWRERGRENPEHAAIVRRHWQRVLRAGPDDPRLEAYRWGVEELRISYFAQPLRTRVPVSAKRLDKLWDDVGASLPRSG